LIRSFGIKKMKGPGEERPLPGLVLSFAVPVFPDLLYVFFGQNGDNGKDKKLRAIYFVPSLMPVCEIINP
jgi:hypothetical protein